MSRGREYLVCESCARRNLVTRDQKNIQLFFPGFNCISLKNDLLFESQTEYHTDD